MRTTYMNPYLAGLLLGLLLVLTIFLTGRGLGASGAYRSALSAVVEQVNPAHVTADPFYAHQPAGTSPLMSWLVFEVVGVMIGAFISGVVSDRLAFFTERPAHVPARQRALALTAMAVGAMVLSRSVGDAGVAAEIRQSARNEAYAGWGLPEAQAAAAE